MQKACWSQGEAGLPSCSPLEEKTLMSQLGPPLAVTPSLGLEPGRTRPCPPPMDRGVIPVLTWRHGSRGAAITLEGPTASHKMAASTCAEVSRRERITAEPRTPSETNRHGPRGPEELAAPLHRSSLSDFLPVQATSHEKGEQQRRPTDLKRRLHQYAGTPLHTHDPAAERRGPHSDTPEYATPTVHLGEHSPPDSQQRQAQVMHLERHS
ncbi:Hypothetical predicted protein [Pelobates cultripes]|uniref:Uncharacterized protein n=1 Tax=Pelobates cultripes TaxID=61616 RepID=A0AAD1TJ30_PELCU|nr:Hypothetical predicted protein [Pelobates cultripes]